MAELDFVARTSSIAAPPASQPTITTTAAALTWETGIFLGPGYTVQGSNTEIKVAAAGRYLVRYDCGVRPDPATGTPTRALVHGTIRVNGSDTAFGRSAAHWRGTQDMEHPALAAGALLELAADDVVAIFAQRVDTATAQGNTTRDHAFEGQLALWRLKSTWPIYRAGLSGDGSASTGSFQVLNFDSVATAEAGWGAGHLTGWVEFDPGAAGSLFDPLTHVFLIAVCMEFDSSSSTIPLEMEMRVRYAPGTGVEPSVKERVLVTSYVDGVTGVTKPTCSFLGIIQGLSGEAFTNHEQLSFEYRHVTTNGTTGTPKAGKCSVQIVAIPKDDLDLFLLRKETGGQAADADAPINFDLEYDGGASWTHNPSASDDSQVRQLEGAWVLLFSRIYCRPMGGARSANRLMHRLTHLVEGAVVAYGGATAFDRGSTDGAERAGCSAHGVYLTQANDDLQAHHDKLNAIQVDANQDLSGESTGATGGFVCAFQGLVLRYLNQKPAPVPIALAVPAVARTLQLNPSAVPILLTAPAATRTLQLVPSPSTLHLAVPAVARTLQLVPSPADLHLAVPAVTRTLQLVPAPVELALALPAIARLVDVTPGPVPLGLVVPAVARLVTLGPDPVALPLLVPAVSRIIDIRPGPVELPLLVPEVSIPGNVTPFPIELGLEVPGVGVLREMAVAPVPLGLAVPSVGVLVTLEPAPVDLSVFVPQVARLITLGPDPVEILILVPSALLSGQLVLLEIAAELLRSMDLSIELRTQLDLGARLEVGAEVLAELERRLELPSELVRLLARVDPVH